MIDRSIYNQYLKEVKSYHLLSAEEEIGLAKRIKKGDVKALQCLINSNLRLVIKIAHHYIAPQSKLMDIIQEGNIGLMTAAKKFSPDFNVRFASYASLWIKQAITRYMSSNDELIRLPTRKSAIVKNIKKFRATFKKENHREPVNQEIIETLGLNEKILKQLYPYIYEPLESLDAIYGDKEESKATLYDYLAQSTSQNPEDAYILKEITEKLDEHLDILGPRDKDILKNRYCMNIEKKKIPFHILGKKYAISPESVRQIEIRALRKLRSNKEIFLESVPM